MILRINGNTQVYREPRGKVDDRLAALGCVFCVEIVYRWTGQYRLFIGDATHRQWHTCRLERRIDFLLLVVPRTTAAFRLVLVREELQSKKDNIDDDDDDDKTDDNDDDDDDNDNDNEDDEDDVGDEDEDEDGDEGEDEAKKQS